MADDIVKRLRNDGGHPDLAHPLCIEAADLIEAQQAEVERLRNEHDDLQVLLRGRTAEFQAEIERLRAAGDAMAEALDALCHSYCGNEDDADLVDAWQEARRG